MKVLNKSNAYRRPIAIPKTSKSSALPKKAKKIVSFRTKPLSPIRQPLAIPDSQTKLSVAPRAAPQPACPDHAITATKPPAATALKVTPDLHTSGLGRSSLDVSGKVQATTEKLISDQEHRKQLSVIGGKLDTLIEMLLRLEAKQADQICVATDVAPAADPERGLGAKEAAALLGVSRSTFYELLKRAEFVKPIQVSKRSVRYSRSELLAWQMAQKAKTGTS